MKSNRGFSLIELLAVIIVLAVISLLVVPTSLKIISKVEMDSFGNSVQNLIKAAQNNCQIERIEGKTITNIYTLTNGKIDSKLNVKGDLPKRGKVILSNNCKAAAFVSNGIYCAERLFDEDEVKVSESSEDCLLYEQPPNLTNYTCKRATTLHTEECRATYDDIYNYYYSRYGAGYALSVAENRINFNCGGQGYGLNGSLGKTTITYGNLGIKGILIGGDAFDCDINGDGVYNDKTERFYYISDYYNTITKEFEKDKAVLLYYSTVSNGLPNTTTAGEGYYRNTMSNGTYDGPKDLIAKLPTISQWKNVKLINSNRNILFENGKDSIYEGNYLPKDFSYGNSAARLLTAQELQQACDIEIGFYKTGELDKCNFLYENTEYTEASSPIMGFWLETPGYITYDGNVYVVSGRERTIVEVESDEYMGIRPVIEIHKDKIEIN